LSHHSPWTKDDDEQLFMDEQRLVDPVVETLNFVTMVLAVTFVVILLLGCVLLPLYFRGCATDSPFTATTTTTINV